MFGDFSVIYRVCVQDLWPKQEVFGQTERNRFNGIDTMTTES